MPPTLGQRHLADDVAMNICYHSSQTGNQAGNITHGNTGSYDSEVREVTNLYGIRNLQVTIISSMKKF